jgi:hypothetical protein
MKHGFLIILCISILSAKVSIGNSDNTNSKLILGYWSFNDKNENFTFYGEYLYKDNGLKEGIAEICMEGKCEKLFFESKWEIQNGFLISSVQKSSSGLLPAGTTIKDEILELNKKTMILLSEDGQEKDIRLEKPKFFK